MAQITVDVGVKLNVMQSSLAELQKVLSHLEPDSSGFKGLSKIINEMTREMEKFQVQTSKGFTSGKQFDQAERSIEKMEETLMKAQIAMGNLKFSDIKLDSNQTKAFNDLEQAIVTAEQRLDSIKEKTKQGIFADSASVLTLERLDKNGIRKTFDEIDAIVANGTKKVEGDLINAKAKFDELNNTVTEQATATGKAKNLLSNGITQQDWGEMLNKAGTGFKSGGKQEFLRILKEQFEVSDADIATLQKLSFGKINEAFKKGNFNDIFKNLDESFKKNSSDLTGAKQKVAEYENLQKAVEDLYNKMNAAKANGTPLSQGMSDYNAEIERVAQALAILRGEAVQNVSANSAFVGSISAMQGQLQGFANQLDQASAAFMRLQQQQQTFNSIKMAITNFMGFNQILNLTKTAIRDAMNHIKELDSVMNGIAIVTDMTTADLWKQVDAYSAMAQNYGVTIKGAYEVSRIYYQQGLETNDVLNLTNETLKLSKISGLDYATTTDYMTTAIRGFKMEMSEASTVVDVYSNLAANTAVSQQELAEAMTRTASSMESVGSTFEETSAMIATMVAVTRESANNIGSAMKSIASRYGELTKDPLTLVDAEGEVMAFNKVDSALQSVGISMKDTEGQFRDFTDVILELSDVWDQLSSVQQRYVATQFAGNRQQSRFLALVSNGDLLRENLEVANDSEDVGTLQALKALDSIESKLNQVQVAYQQFYTTLGAEDLWKGLLDGTTNFINTLNGLPKLFGKIPIGAATVIADAISLIKTVALNGLSAIATQFKSHLDGHVESLDLRGKGQKAGNDFNEGLRQGLSTSSSFSEINREIEVTKQRLNDLSDISKTIVFKRDSNGEIINPQVISNAITRLQDLKAITDEEAKSLRELANEGPEKALEKIKELAIANKEFAGSLTQIKNQKIYDSLLDFSSALNIVANVMDKSTDSSRIFAGSLMFVSGAIKGISSVMKAMETKGPFPWVTVAMAAITAINGIATAIETPQEKLERLNKEAEELSNTAKQVKADEKTLQTGIDKVNELKEKRYESAEAAEEYQKAVDDLADSFPQLISGFDSSGNIIIETANAEEMLAAARQKTLQATYDAAVGEQKANQQKMLTTANEIKNLNNRSGEITDNSFSFDDTANSTRLADRAYGMLRNAMGGFLNFDEVGQYLEGILNQDTSADYLRDIVERSGAKIDLDQIKDISSFSTEINKSIQAYNEAGKKIPDSLQGLNELANLLLSSDFSTEQSLETSQAIVKDFINHLDNYDFNSEFGQQKLNEFLEAYNSLSEETKELINKNFDVSQLNKLNVELANLSGENAGLRNSVVSSYLLLDKSLEENWKFLNENTQGALLLTRQLSSIWGQDKNNNKTWEQFKETDDFKNALNEYYKGYNDLNKEQKDILEKIGNDTSAFTANDVKKELNLDESNKAINEAIDNLYTSTEDSIERLNNIFNTYSEPIYDTTSGEKIDETLPTALGKLKTSLEKRDLSSNALDFISAQVKQIDELEKQGFVQAAGELSNNTSNLINALYQDNISAFDRNSIINILNQSNLNTTEGIEEAISSIESSGADQSVIKSTVKQLEARKQRIVDNVALSIQSELDSLLEKAEDDTKILSKATSGMTMKEANELVNKAKGWGVDLDIGSDIISNGDKLILSEQAFNEIQQKYGEHINEAAEKVQENLKKAQSAGLLDSNNQVSIPDVEEVLSEEMREFLSANGFNYDETTKKYLDSNGQVLINEANQLTEAGQKTIELLFENIFNGLEDYGMAVEQIQAMIFQQENWNKGDYSSLLNGQFMKKPNQKSRKQARITGIPALETFDTEAFNKYLSGTERYDAANQPELKVAVEKARGGVDTLLSDLLSKGIDNFNITDYANTGIESSTFNEMSAAIKDWQDSYEDFVRNYANLTGKNATEIDALIAQARAKDYENNAYDALKDVIDSFDNFSYEAGQKLARSIDGVSLEDFDVNTVTGELSSSYENMLNILNNSALDKTSKQYLELRGKLESANAKIDNTARFVDIVSKRDKLTEENVATLAEIFGTSYDFISNLIKKEDDGTYKMNLAELDRLIQTGKIKVTEELKQMIANEIDGIISSLTGLSSLQGKGTTSIEDMRKRVSSVNEQLGTSFDISALFEYDETVHGFVYSTTGLIASVQSLSQQLNSLSGDERWAAEQLINDTKRQFAEAIDITGFLGMANGDPARALKIDELQKAIEDYNAVLFALGETEGLNADNIISALKDGGENAVKAAEEIAKAQGTTLSDSDIEAAYRNEVANFVNAIDTVIAKPGEIIDSATAEIIALSGGKVNELGESGQYVVETAANLYEAYNNLLTRLEATGEATLADLNKVAALALENRDGEQAAIDALGDATGMTFTRFGEILADAGIQLTETMINDLETSGIIDLMGGNKMRIADFSRFADLMGWDANSEEYVSAFKTYNDSLIEMNRKAENNILEEVNALGDAKGGDWLNLTQLSERLETALEGKIVNKGAYDVPAFDNFIDILNSMGGHLQDGILKLDSEANIPGILSTIASYAQQYGGLLQSDMAQLADTLDSVLQSYVDAISKGISGKLSNSDAFNLQQMVDSLDMNVNLEFTKTAEGMKLTKQSAIELYQELQKIDSLKAQLVFDDLYDSLTGDLGGGFDSMSDTMATIAETQKQIRENWYEIRKLEAEDPGDARAQRLRQQNAELENQLDLYNQIANKQAGDPDSYNFMNGKLPDYLQGPANYWDSVGKAYKTMNEAASAGTIDLTDYYNIVNEMSNLAAMSGQLEVDGQKFASSAEMASYLIEQGANALTNVDGEGVKVDLSRLGVNFVTGANNMQDNFQDGIKAMAESQIAMLDAAIQVMETVVAMEKLGDIDVDSDGLLNLGEIFNGTTDAAGDFTKGYTEWADSIYKVTHDPKAENYNEDLAKALDHLSINGTSLKDMIYAARSGLENAADAWKDLGMTEEQYAKVINSFYQAARNGDYNLENVTESVWDILEQTLPDGTVIKTGQRSVVVSGKTHYVIDWESEEVSDALALVAKEHPELTGNQEELQRELEEAFTAYSQGKATEIQVKSVLVARGLIEVDPETGDITVDGQTYKADSPAAKKAIAEASLKAAGAENIETEMSTDETERKKTEIKSHGTLTIGQTTIDVLADENGNVKYIGPNGKEYGSIKELKDGLIEERYQKELQNQSDKLGALSETEREAEEVKIKKRITAQVEYEFSDQTDNTVNGTQKQIGEYLQKDEETRRTEIENAITEALKKGPDEQGQYTAEIPGGIEVTGFEEELTTDKVLENIEKSYDPEGVVSKIADGIGKAFEGEAGAQIGAKIAEGLTTALAGAEGETQEILIPEITIKPNKINFNTENISKAAEQDLNADVPEIPLATAKATVETLEITSVTSSKLSDGTVIDLTDAVNAKGTAGSLELTAAGIEATLAEGNPIKISGAIDSTGTAGTLTITLNEGQNGELEHSGDVDVGSVGNTTGNSEQLTIEATNKKLSEENPDVGQIGSITGTSNDAKINATSYQITFVGENGSSNTVVVNGTANLVATLAQYGVGFDANGNLTNVGKYNVDVEPNDTNVDLTTTANMDGAEAAVNTWAANKVVQIQVKTASVDGATTEVEADPILATELKNVTDFDSLSVQIQVSGAENGISTLEQYKAKIQEVLDAGQQLNSIDLTNIQTLSAAGLIDINLPTATSTIDNLEITGANNATYDGTLTLTEDISEGQGNISNLTVGATNLTANSGLAALQGMDFSTTSSSLLGVQQGVGKISRASFSNFSDLSGMLEVIKSQVESIWDTVKQFANQTFTVTLQQQSGTTNTDTETTENKTVNTTQNTTVNVDTSGAQGSAKALSTAAASMGASLTVAATKVKNLATAATKIPNKAAAVQSLASAIKDIPSRSSLVSNLASAMKQIPDVASRVKGIADALNRIPTSKSFSMDVTVNVKATGAGTGGGIEKFEFPPKAKGNVALSKGTGPALAGGRRTLVGELGPELVVSGGKYYVVGQNGAEFVDLAPDAIVFNHLQTRELLKHGSSSRGDAVTSEKNAVALAGGTSGPAMASASAALSALKQLRAMWESLATASAKDLGALAGRGGKGGGGGGGCFVAGTPIATRNGFKNIEDIEVGDIVLSYNEETRKNEYSEVLQTMIHDVEEDIYTLHIEDEELVVTGIHRFLIGNEWIPASALATGNLVRFADGTLHAISEIDIEEMAIRVYNFEVSNNHNYYVGNNSILAHNKGGGGGGGGGADDNGENRAVTAEIQRWYNLTRQIAKAEKDITYQQALRSKYQSDFVVNGDKIYATYQKELAILRKEVRNQKELVELQKSWYDAKRKELEASDYGKIFTYDENGLQQYVGSGAPGSGRGLDILEKLNERDVNGQPINNAKSARAQLKYLRSVGFNLSDLLYNDDGTKAAKSINQNTLAVKKNNSKDKKNDIYVKMMENFWNNIDGWRDELDNLYDSYNDTLTNIEENQTKQNEILQELRDNELDIEQELLKAIESRQQALIDEKTELKDALKDASDAYISGLSEALDKERKQYEQNQGKDELTKLQRQLAILQRSGGSASQIRSLQEQISGKQRDVYFDERQGQIDAIQEASDKEIEALEREIDIMTETLEYQKENGLLWKDVRDIMANESAQSAWDKILAWDSEMKSKSALDIDKTATEFMDKFDTFAAKRDEDKAWKEDKTGIDTSQDESKYSKLASDSTALKAARDNAMSAAEGAYRTTLEDGGTREEAKRAAQKAYDDTMASESEKYNRTENDRINQEKINERNGLYKTAQGQAALDDWNKIVENAKYQKNSFVYNKNYPEYADEVEEKFVREMMGNYDEDGKWIGGDKEEAAKTATASATEILKEENAFGEEQSDGSRKGIYMTTKGVTSYTIKKSKVKTSKSFGKNVPITLTGKTKTIKKKGKDILYLQGKVDGKTKYFLANDFEDATQDIHAADATAAIDTSADKTNISLADKEPITYSLKKGVPKGHGVGGKENPIDLKAKSKLQIDGARATFDKKGNVKKVTKIRIKSVNGQDLVESDEINLSKFNSKDRKGILKKIQAQKYGKQAAFFYKQGGLADYTGPAWVDGTPKKPEAFLNAAQTQFVRNDLLGNSKTSLVSIVSALQDAISNTATSPITNNSNAVSIDNVNLTIESGVIANDYDARRAGSNITDEILKIAKKSGNLGISRR